MDNNNFNIFAKNEKDNVIVEASPKFEESQQQGGQHQLEEMYYKGLGKVKGKKQHF